MEQSGSNFTQARMPKSASKLQAALQAHEDSSFSEREKSKNKGIGKSSLRVKEQGVLGAFLDKLLQRERGWGFLRRAILCPSYLQRDDFCPCFS